MRVRVTETGPGSLFAEQAFTVTVTPGNAAPSITSPPVTSATVGGLYEYPVVATDPNGDTLTFTLPTVPTGMSINSATGLITWTPTAQQVGPQAVRVRVTDPGNLSAEQAFTVTVTPGNAAPSIISPPVTSATVGGPYQYAVMATDPNGDTLTFTLPTVPTGMSINSATGLITWTPTAQQVGPQAVRVRVTDPGNLSAEQAFTVTVTPGNAAPSITSPPVTSATVGGPINMR